MGYTHYWSKKSDVDEKQYAAALKDIAKIVTTQKIAKLGNGLGDQGTKPKTTGGIEFNGIDSDSHETFSLPAKASQISDFEFCKTAEKPYDIVVVAVLARLSEVAGIHVSSDGNADDWTAGVQLASKILGRQIANPREEKKDTKKTVTTKPSLKLVKSFMTRIQSRYIVAEDIKTDPKFYKKRGFGPTSMETETWIAKIVKLKGDQQRKAVKDLLDSIQDCEGANERYVLNNLAARRIDTKGLHNYNIGD